MPNSSLVGQELELATMLATLHGLFQDVPDPYIYNSTNIPEYVSGFARSRQISVGTG